jgi:hypothetical protein
VKQDVSKFPERFNYNKVDNPKDLVRVIGAEKTRELIRRKQQIADTYHNIKPIEFK